MGRALVNKNKKESFKKEEVVEEKVVVAEAEVELNEGVELSEYIETELGEKLPRFFEGKKVMSVGARKQIGGVTYYNCECSDRGTYDVPVKK